MTNELFTSVELIAVLAAYCAAFIPVFAWVLAHTPSAPKIQ